MLGDVLCVSVCELGWWGGGWEGVSNLCVSPNCLIYSARSVFSYEIGLMVPCDQSYPPAALHSSQPESTGTSLVSKKLMPCMNVREITAVCLITSFTLGQVIAG